MFWLTLRTRSLLAANVQTLHSSSRTFFFLPPNFENSTPLFCSSFTHYNLALNCHASYLLLAWRKLLTAREFRSWWDCQSHDIMQLTLYRREQQTRSGQFCDCWQGSESRDTIPHAWPLPSSTISCLKQKKVTSRISLRYKGPTFRKNPLLQSSWQKIYRHNTSHIKKNW